MKDIKVWLIFIKWMSLQFKNVNKKYKLKNKLSIIRNILIVREALSMEGVLIGIQ